MHRKQYRVRLVASEVLALVVLCLIQAPTARLLAAPGLSFIPGPVNGAFIERNGKILAVYGDPSGQRPTPDTVLLVEARRDVTWAARDLAKQGAKVV